MYLLINALAFFSFLYLLAVFRNYKRRRGLPYPPGPPSRPIIGNLLDIPKDTPWTVYADMSKKYGMREHSYDTCNMFAQAEICIPRRRCLPSRFQSGRCRVVIVISH
jgi:hypothetical protein